MSTNARTERGRIGSASPDTGTGRGAGFITALAAEWTKLTTLRSMRRAPVACAVTGGLVAAMFLLTLEATVGTPLAMQSANEVASTSVLGADAAALLIIVLTAAFATSEHGTGLIAYTLTVTPKRGRRLAAAATAVGVWGLLCGVLAALAAYAVGQAVALGAGAPVVGLTDPATARMLAGAALMSPFYAVVALAAAEVTRSLPGGVAGALAVLVAPTLMSWVPSGALDPLLPFTPAEALHAVGGVGGPDALGPFAGLAALGAWLVVILFATRFAANRDA